MNKNLEMFDATEIIKKWPKRYSNGDAVVYYNTYGDPVLFCVMHEFGGLCTSQNGSKMEHATLQLNEILTKRTLRKSLQHRESVMSGLSVYNPNGFNRIWQDCNMICYMSAHNCRRYVWLSLAEDKLGLWVTANFDQGSTTKNLLEFNDPFLFDKLDHIFGS